jgi:hypothetical protein
MKREMNFKNLPMTLILLAGLSACGSQNYTAIATTSTSQAPGTFSIAPKVDIIVVEDDTGSMFEPYTTISSQLSSFVGALDSQNWDYHFGIVPLTTSRAFSQAIASKQDVNWGSMWVSPYPGATIAGSTPESLPSYLFTTLIPYSGINFPIFDGYIQNANINNSLNGSEPGFSNVTNTFQKYIAGSGFLRPDALLSVIFIGNGNDTSNVNFCRRADNVMVPCEQLTVPVCTTTSPPFTLANGSTSCQSAAASYNYYQQIFAQQSSAMRVYAAVAQNTNFNGSCDGGNATQGARYQELAANFGGQSYDVCSQGLSSIFAGIQQNLTTTVLNYVKSFVVVDPNLAPDPTTIQVQKYVNGSSSDATTILRLCGDGGVTTNCDPTNGWSYAGDLTNQDTITYPIGMSPESGYMIQLHGTSELHGQDTAYIVFKYTNGQSGSTTSN